MKKNLKYLVDINDLILFDIDGSVIDTGKVENYNKNHDGSGRFSSGPGGSLSSGSKPGVGDSVDISGKSNYDSGAHKPLKGSLSVGSGKKVIYKKIDGDPKKFIDDNFAVPNMITNPQLPGKHEDTVNYFRDRIKNKKVIPPITAREIPGSEGTFANAKLSIDDGYHRTQAYYLEGIQPAITVFKIDQAQESRAYMEKWEKDNSWWGNITKKEK